MSNTTEKQIKLFKDRLSIFENRVPSRYLDKFLEPQPRIKQHALFFSLINPRVFSAIKESLNAVKQYNKSKYFPKVLDKLFHSPQWLDQQKAIFEIIVAGYYFKKFIKKDPVFVEWDQVNPWGKKIKGISICGLRKTIHLDVLDLKEDEKIKNNSDLLYKIKVELGEKIEKLDEKKYSYTIDVLTPKKEVFTEEQLSGFISFVLEKIKQGPGKYFFPNQDNALATAQITPLSEKNNKDYITRVDPWSGILQEKGRLKKLIITSACNEIDPEKINVLFLPNLGGLNIENAMTSFLGPERKRGGSLSRRDPSSRNPTGAINKIHERGCATVSAFVVSGLDYRQKEVIKNPLPDVHEKTWGVIQ